MLCSTSTEGLWSTNPTACLKVCWIFLNAKQHLAKNQSIYLTFASYMVVPSIIHRFKGPYTELLEDRNAGKIEYSCVYELDATVTVYYSI